MNSRGKHYRKAILYKAAFVLRRVGDSNPRDPFEYTRFPGVLLKPLGQLSVQFQGAKI
jgi:hypothetical protein